MKCVVTTPTIDITSKVLGLTTDMGHLEDVGMGYFEHMIGAYKLGLRYTLGAVQLLFRIDTRRLY